jgi:WD40 repeat protein
MRCFPIIVAAWLVSALVAAVPADGPAGKISAADLDRLILQLGDDDMAKRAQARERLEVIGTPAMANLKHAVESADDPEVRTAAKALLEKLAAKASGLIHMFGGSNPNVTAVAISAAGRIGVSAHDDWAIRIWDLEHHTLIRQIARHVTPVLCVAISPDGRRVLSGSAARLIRLWDRDTGKEVRNFFAPAEAVYDVAFSPDGKSLLSGWGDGNARLFDLETGQVRQTFMTSQGGRAWAVAFTPDGKQAVTGGGNMNEQPGATAVGAFQLWDLTSGKLVRRFDGHASDIRRVAVSPDGKQLLSASYDGTVRLWDSSTGKELKKFDGPGYASATLTSDGKRAIASYNAGQGLAAHEDDPRCMVRLWDLATDREVRVFKGHRGPVNCFAISADGRRLLSGGADGTMGLWEMPK